MTADEKGREPEQPREEESFKDLDVPEGEGEDVKGGIIINGSEDTRMQKVSPSPDYQQRTGGDTYYKA